MATKKLNEKLKNFSLLNAPGHLLRRSHQRSYEIFARAVGDDVTRQQIALLISLFKIPGASQRDLVDATGIDKSTLKEMLGRMIGRGWVERERDPNDNRAWTMRISEEGEQFLGDRFDAVEAAQQEILEPLADSDRVHFLQCLRIISGTDNVRGADGTACAQVARSVGQSAGKRPMSPER